MAKKYADLRKRTMSPEAQERAAARAKEILLAEELIKCVPSSWLDPLLTGPDAVVGPPPWNCLQVESLLNGIRKRMRAALTEGLSR